MARSAFKFRLKRLLDVRIMREKLAQQTLIELKEVHANEQHKLEQIRQQEQQLRQEQARPLERGEDLQDFAQRRSWLEKEIKENIQAQGNQQRRIEEAWRAVEAQQLVVKQAGIDVKALEKVEDKQREEHRLEQLREESLFMDDLAGQGYLRRRNHAALVEAEEQQAKEQQERR